MMVNFFGCVDEVSTLVSFFDLLYIICWSCIQKLKIVKHKLKLTIQFVLIRRCLCQKTTSRSHESDGTIIVPLILWTTTLVGARVHTSLDDGRLEISTSTVAFVGVRDDVH
jgi:hypothetical protein